MSKEFYEKYWKQEWRSVLNDRLTPKRLEIFINEVKEPFKKRVLDAGCGVGHVFWALKKAGFEVIGIDISQQAINEARASFPDIQFIRAPLDSRLVFLDKSFDAIYCAETIEHVYDTDMAISEMGRILKPKGLLFISTPYHGLIKNLIIVLTRFEKHFSPNKSHIRFFSKNSLKKMLKKNGFKIRKNLFFGKILACLDEYGYISREKIINKQYLIYD